MQIMVEHATIFQPALGNQLSGVSDATIEGKFQCHRWITRRAVRGSQSYDIVLDLAVLGIKSIQVSKPPVIKPLEIDCIGP